MTTDTKTGSEVTGLCATLLDAAGPGGVLTPVALRGLLTGVDESLISAALSCVLAEGVTLPPTVVTAFGLSGGSAPRARPGLVAHPHSQPTAPAPEQPPLDAVPARPDAPRFAVDLAPGARLDLTALNVLVLRPDPAPTLPPAPPPIPPAQPAPQPVEQPQEKEEQEGTAEAPPAPQPEYDSFWSFWFYRNQIGRFSLLTRQREAELAHAIEAGLFAREKLRRERKRLVPRMRRDLERIATIGEQALTEFAESNLRLVVSVAHKYTGRGVELLDLIQEGNLGLLHAIEMFDHTKGFKFSTYATHWIRQVIQRAIADQSRTIRLPVYAHDTVTALRRAARELGLRTPADDLPAVAARAGVREDNAGTLLSQVPETVPLEDLISAIGDNAFHEEADRTVSGPHRPEADMYYRDLSPEEVHDLVSRLTDREALVLSMRHGLDGGPPATLDEIGRELEVTRERVRQIESKAVVELLSLIRCHQRPWRRSQAVADVPASAPQQTDETAVTPVVLTNTSRRVPRSGRITVAKQTICLGTERRGECVTVLVEDTRLRVLHEGRQIAVVPRLHILRRGNTDGFKG